MTERQEQPFSGKLRDRQEYTLEDTVRFAQLKDEAFDDVTSVLDWQRTIDQSDHVYGFSDGVGVRELNLTSQDPVMRTDMTVKLEKIQQGEVQAFAEVTLREFVRSTQVQFLSQYTIAQLAGERFHALYTTKNPEQEYKMTQSVMTPYDFAQMAKVVKRIKAMQHYELLTDERRRALHERLEQR